MKHEATPVPDEAGGWVLELPGRRQPGMRQRVIPPPRSSAESSCPQHPGAARRGAECAGCWSELYGSPILCSPPADQPVPNRPPGRIGPGFDGRAEAAMIGFLIRYRAAWRVAEPKQ